MNMKRKKRRGSKVLYQKGVAMVTLFAFLTLFLTPFAQAQTLKMRLAVLNFDNASPDKKGEGLSTTIADTLSTFLIKYAQDEVTIVERRRLSSVLQEMGLQKSGFTDEKSALEAGRLANATHIILGSYSIVKKAITINARIVDVETGKAIYAESVTGRSGEEALNQVNRLAAKFVEQLTGRKVKVETFRDVSNPFSQIFHISKHSILPWIIGGVILVGAAVFLLSKNSQSVSQTTTVKKAAQAGFQLKF